MNCFKSFLVFYLAVIISLNVVVNGEEAEDAAKIATGTRKGRLKSVTPNDFLPCAITMDSVCFIDVADDFLEEKRTDLLAEADQSVMGRSKDESPTQLSSVITKLISELSEIFKDGFSGFFRNAKEEDEEEDDDEEEEGVETTEDEDNKSQVSRKSSSEARKKKKKGKIHKLIGIIKLLVIGAVLKAKLTLLLKILSAKLQIKFFLIALAGLILNAARFYLDLKKGHQPQKVIYYEHAQHQHHYDGAEDEGWSSGPGTSEGHGGSYWGRSYDEEEMNNKSAQDLAYAKQKPSGVVYSRVDNKPNYSWFGS